MASDALDRTFDHARVRQAFSRAARSYAQAAVLQHEVEDRLLEQLFALQVDTPRRVLDLGCGPGRGAAKIKQHWRRSEVIAMDLSPGMLRETRAQSRFWRPLKPVCADALQLPFADASFDAVSSSLCLQWVGDLPRALNEVRRVLRPGGVFVMSTFGPDTLLELRESYLACDIAPPLSPFAAIAQIGDALLQTGFRDPMALREHFTLTYADARAVARDLKAIGATDARRERPRGLHGRDYWRRIETAYAAFRDADGRLPSTWEVINAQAFAPADGAPIRDGAAEIASFDASRIRIRSR